MTLVSRVAIMVLTVAATVPCQPTAADVQHEGRSVASWIADCASSDGATRTRALQALGSLGPKAAPAVPALLKALETPDPELRFAVLTGLKGIGAPATEKPLAIAHLLSDHDARIRLLAARILAAHPRTDETVVPHLAITIEDAKGPLLQALARALTVQGKPLQDYGGMATKHLDSKDPQVRLDVALALAAADFRRAQPWKALQRELETRPASEWKRVFDVLAPHDIGSSSIPLILAGLEQGSDQAVDGVLALVASLARKIPDMRPPPPRSPAIDPYLETLRVLVRHGHDVGKDYDRILAGLEDSRDAVRIAAAETLAWTKPRGPADLAVLDRVLSSQAPPRVRAGVLRALVNGGAPRARLASSLARLVRDSDKNVRRLAAHLLGKYGPDARVAERELARAIPVETDRRAHHNQVWALACLQPQDPASVPVLTHCLASSNEGVRQNASFALRFLAPASKTAVPGLIALLDDDVAVTRVNAMIALKALGPLAAPATTSLVRRLFLERNADGLHVLNALAAIGPAAAPESLDVLLRYLALSDSGSLRRTTVKAILAVLPGDDAAADALETHLRARGHKTRLSILHVMQIPRLKAPLGKALVALLLQPRPTTPIPAIARAATAAGVPREEVVRTLRAASTRAPRRLRAAYVDAAIEHGDRAWLSTLLASPDPTDRECAARKVGIASRLSPAEGDALVAALAAPPALLSADPAATRQHRVRILTQVGRLGRLLEPWSQRLHALMRKAPTEEMPTWLRAVAAVRSEPFEEAEVLALAARGDPRLTLAVVEHLDRSTPLGDAARTFLEETRKHASPRIAGAAARALARQR